MYAKRVKEEVLERSDPPNTKEIDNHTRLWLEAGYYCHEDQFS